jgi:hypothetical protein
MVSRCFGLAAGDSNGANDWHSEQNLPLASSWLVEFTLA